MKTLFELGMAKQTEIKIQKCRNVKMPKYKLLNLRGKWKRRKKRRNEKKTEKAKKQK
jgi:hypothetical protein